MRLGMVSSSPGNCTKGMDPIHAEDILYVSVLVMVVEITKFSSPTSSPIKSPGF